MTTFKDFKLSENIKKAIDDLGFTEPTEIQKKAIPEILETKKDVIALAQTGTGKTAAFAIPVLEKILKDPDFNTKDNKNVKAIVLCPTRELALQVKGDFQDFAKHESLIKILAIYGGESIEKQIKELKRKPQIIVGTPGRVRDMINRSKLNVEKIKHLVLDEADEMLNMGFKEELDAILETTPKEKQVLLFSATMNKAVKRVAKNYMSSFIEISAGQENKATDNVKHIYYEVAEKNRYKAVKRIIDLNEDIHGIVFCRTRIQTQEIADKLKKDNYKAEAIHGEISQNQRTAVMKKFRKKEIKLLIATDVAARGIDVSELSHIINYNLPESTESYVHRSGRTGRAKHQGISMLIINMREHYKIKHLEKRIGQTFEKGTIPKGKEVFIHKLRDLIKSTEKIDLKNEKIQEFNQIIMSETENLKMEELCQKLIYKHLNSDKQNDNYLEDLNASKESEKEFLLCEMKINVGKKQDLTVKDLLGFINEEGSLRNINIEKITIDKNHTTFEIEHRDKNKIIDFFTNHELEISCEKEGIVKKAAPRKRRERQGFKKRPYNRRSNNNKRNDNKRGDRNKRKVRYSKNSKKY